MLTCALEGFQDGLKRIWLGSLNLSIFSQSLWDSSYVLSEHFFSLFPCVLVCLSNLLMCSTLVGSPFYSD